MKMLVLGGTVFVGRHVVETALRRGHEVTLFHRGQSYPELFPQVERLLGDRDGQLDSLRRRTWDVVVDPSGYVPRIVGQSARLLADAVERYIFISTISVYADYQTPNQNESAPLAVLPDPSTEIIDGQRYGGLKALCERVIDAAIPLRALHARPGLIVGPHDPTDRFTYWCERVQRGGRVLVPGRPDLPTQYLDVRDLAAWLVDMAEQREAGVFNLCGPRGGTTISEVLNTCREVTGSDAKFVWVPESFLKECDVKPFSELPLWVPSSVNGLMSVNCDKALARGLRLRPLAETVTDTLAWAATKRGDEWQYRFGTKVRGGMDANREADLLAIWDARTR